MIFFRVDANKEIGMGHLMRCLSIADSLRMNKKQVAFICAKDTDTTIIEKRGFDFCVLSTAYTDMMAEVATITELLMSMESEMYIVDTYQVSRDYLFALKPFTKLCLIEDIHDTKYPVDVLINYNLHAEGLDYSDVYPGTKLLLGPKYAPVRNEFVNTNFSVKNKAKSIMVTTGGADMYNLSELICEKLLAREETRDLKINLISGALNANLPKLQEIAKAHDNVTVYSNVSNMAELMEANDVAITAAGSTVCELLCVGVPFACVSFVDNQKLLYEYCKNSKVCLCASNYETDGEAAIDEIIDKVVSCLDSYAKRMEASKQGKQIVDGNGAMRIARELL